MHEHFAPTLAAAHARVAAVHLAAYARTRNAIDGAVSGLSPYVTHGFITLADVLAGVVFCGGPILFPRYQLQAWLPLRLRLTLVASVSCLAGAAALL